MAQPNVLTDLKSLKVGFIGCGNMASAIGAGLIRKGLINADNVWVSGRTNRSFPFWDNFGAHTTQDNLEVIRNSDIIFIAVKPQMLDAMLSKIDPNQSKEIPRKLFISVLLGITLKSLIIKLDPLFKEPGIVRSMPNTPMMVGEGIIVYCSTRTSTDEEILVKTLFSSLGMSRSVPEDLMHSVGALSGCGPAYAYLMIDAMADGAVKVGVPRTMAIELAAQVLMGAGKMVLDTERSPGQLKDEVCSPGGSTITGIHAMERGGVRAALIDAVEAAFIKSNEISSKFNE